MNRQAEVVLVLGATGGIGSTVAERLVAEGTHVVAAARSRERLDALAARCPVEVREVDASNVEGVAGLAEDVAAACGRLDGIVNCVGTILLKPAHMTSAAEWEATLASNLTSAFAVVRAGVRAMRKHGGRIVLVSSAAARVGLANHEAIAAAKAGIEGLTRAAAATYAAAGIRVNAVAPGLVETPGTARITASPTARAASERMHPVGRIGQPDDVASAIVWLLDRRQSWVTGQVIGVDGGLGTLRSSRT